MNNLARNLNSDDVVQEVGTISCVEPGRLTVRTCSGDYSAKRATSCLLKPMIDDMVLVATLPQGRCYVLAVLEREDAAAEICVEGDLSLNLPNGKLTMSAQEGIDMISRDQIDLATQRFSLNALEGNIVFQKLSYLGRFLQSEVDKVKSFATTVDSVFERLSQRVKRSYRTVEDFDQLRAERVDYRAKKTMNLHGQNTIMTAKELVKLDAEQIHVG